jgi:type III secretion protein T
MDLVNSTSSTETYLSFFSALAEFAPITLLSLFLLGLFRIAPIVALVPFFGARVPGPIKMGLLIALTIVMLPHIVLTSHTMVGFNSEFALLCFKELFIGILLAFFASVPFYMAESAGIVIDFQRGSSALQVTDPSTQEQTSDIGVLYNYVLIIIFYEVNGPFYFFNALFDSYTVLPPDKWLTVLFFNFNHPFWKEIWTLVASIFAVGIQLAAPSLLAILMTEMFLGIANRLAPQVQIVFLGMSLKSLVGLAVLCAAWFFIMQQLGKLSLIWMQNLTKAVYLIQA